MDVLEAVKKEMFRRRLSPRTMQAYLFYVRKFLVFCKKPPKEFSRKDCREFLLEYSDKGVSGSSLNVAHMALRFMMEEVLRRSMRLNLRYAKTRKSMPTMLSMVEVGKLLEAIQNPKHRLLVSLMYGAALRVSEVVKLRDSHFEEGMEYGWVRRGKGNKDRPFRVPDCLKQALLEKAQQKGYIFRGRDGHLSAKSVQMIVRRAAKLAGIRKNVHPHTLRHSCATHWVESGVDITAVQALLGHNEARTTMTYLHMQKPKLVSVRSPLDAIWVSSTTKGSRSTSAP